MKRSRWILLALSLLVFGAPGWNAFRESRQGWLNRRLIAAIEQNDSAKALAALAAGANPNAHDTPAAHLSVWQLLMNRLQGTPIPSPSEGPTALELLLEGAYQGRYSRSGPAALRPEEETFRIVQTLVARGADVNAESADDGTPLQLALCGGHARTIWLLLDRGANVNAISRYGSTPLTVAVSYSSAEIVRCLLERGADVNGKNRVGGTPLMYTAGSDQKDAIETLRLLLAKGADVNARMDNDRTALMSAAEQNHLEAAKLLVKAGADANAISKNGQTALTLASDPGFPHPAMLRFLKQAGAKQ